MRVCSRDIETGQIYICIELGDDITLVIRGLRNNTIVVSTTITTSVIILSGYIIAT